MLLSSIPTDTGLKLLMYEHSIGKRHPRTFSFFLFHHVGKLGGLGSRETTRATLLGYVRWDGDRIAAGRVGGFSRKGCESWESVVERRRLHSSRGGKSASWCVGGAHTPTTFLAISCQGAPWRALLRYPLRTGCAVVTAVGHC